MSEFYGIFNISLRLISRGSIDNGSSWDNATSPTAKNLYGVTFRNNTFFAAGISGNIVRSTDNGSSWDNATSPTAKNLYAVPSYE